MNENLANNSFEHQKEHRVTRGGREWIWATVLILLGLIFLGQN